MKRIVRRILWFFAPQWARLLQDGKRNFGGPDDRIESGEEVIAVLSHGKKTRIIK